MEDREGMRSLSELPADIIQHIVSYSRLTEKEETRLSVLSKDFLTAIRNRRTLVINHSMITKGCIHELISLRNTLARYKLENINLVTFEFRVKYHQNHLPSEFIHLPGECIDLATKLSPRNLNLELFGRSRYGGTLVESVLPQTVFGVESVVQMCLKDCVLKLERLKQWPNLKRLRLEYVVGKNMEDIGVFIERLMRSSPLLEILEISGTNCFSFLHSKLCCKNLRILSLIGKVMFWDNYFIDLGQNFPRLENLSLDLRYMKYMHMKSQSLKKLELLNIQDCLREAQFDVPNVVCNGFGIIQAISCGIRLEGNPDTETDDARPCKRSRYGFQMPGHFPELRLEVNEKDGAFTLKRVIKSMGIHWGLTTETSC